MYREVLIADIDRDAAEPGSGLNQYLLDLNPKLGTMNCGEPFPAPPSVRSLVYLIIQVPSGALSALIALVPSDRLLGLFGLFSLSC